MVQNNVWTVKKDKQTETYTIVFLECYDLKKSFFVDVVFAEVHFFKCQHFQNAVGINHSSHAEEMAISIATATMQGAVIGQYVKCLVKNGYKFENASDQEVRSEKSPSCMEHQELVTED